MADFNISGIWITKTDDSEYISHVMLHEEYKTGKKTSKEVVLKHLKDKKTIETIVWNYKTIKWDKGAEVTEEHLNKTYLRTTPDKTITNNLHHLIRMGFFGI